METIENFALMVEKVELELLNEMRRMISERKALSAYVEAEKKELEKTIRLLCTDKVSFDACKTFQAMRLEKSEELRPFTDRIFALGALQDFRARYIVNLHHHLKVATRLTGEKKQARMELLSRSIEARKDLEVY